MKTKQKQSRVGGAKKREVVRDTTVVVAVGCGGIFYHGLSRMATFCNRRLKVRVVLIDPDKVEKKNAARQWGFGVGMDKVSMAAGVLYQRLLGCSVTTRAAAVDSPKDLVTMIGYDEQFKEEQANLARTNKRYGEGTVEVAGGYWDEVARMIVVCAPDNHLCRVNVHKGCGLLASGTGIEVMEITTGNGPDYGYAYGCVHTQEIRLNRIDDKTGKRIRDIEWVCEGDWVKGHPDIVTEAKQEARRLAHPASCGAMEEQVAGQTMTTNQLTAMCVWDLAELMVDSAQVGEVYWTREKDPRVEGNMISVVRAKLAERT